MEQTFERDGKLWKKTWEPCWKCDGAGGMEYYAHYARGICFSCGGSKGKWIERRVLNEKEQERRDKAKARKEKLRNEERAERLKNRAQEYIVKMGFENGSIHVVALENTFSIKDELRESGAHFKKEFGWFFYQPTDLYPTVEITTEEGLLMDNGIFETHPQVRMVIQNKISSMVTQSEWIGQIGDKVEITVTLKRSTCFETVYGNKWIYIFESNHNNINGLHPNACS